MIDTASAVSFLQPPRIELVVDGKAYVLTPVVTKEIGALARAIDPLVGELLYGGEPHTDLARLISLLGTHADSVIEAVAICTRGDRDEIGKLLPDRVAALALAAMEVNFDFFSRTIPLLRSALPGLAPRSYQRFRGLAAQPAPTTAGPGPSPA